MKHFLFISFYILSLPFIVQADDYFWVGGSGNWSDAGHWATTSGGATFHAQAPGADDDVFFDVNSFTAVGQTVTVDLNPSNCLSMDWTGVINSPKLRIATLAALDIYGDMILVANMDLEFASQFGSRIRMQSAIIGRTLTTAGQDLVNLRFEGSGAWTLQDALSSSSELFVSNGNLISGGHDVNTDNLLVNGGSASLDLTNSLFTTNRFTVTSSSSVILTNSQITATEVAINPSGIAFSILELTGNNPTLTGNNLSFEALILSGTVRTEVSGSHTITKSLSATQAGSQVQIASGATLTLDGTLGSMGGACADLILWRSSNSGSAFTLSKSSGTVTVEHLILQDFHASGGATFTANNSINQGNTTGWTINAPVAQTYYWIADNGGDWSDGNNWSTSTGGAPAGCSPTSADHVIFDANSFNTAAAQPVVIVDDNLQQARDMTWTGVANKPILRIPSLSQLEIYGNLSLTAGMGIDFVTPASSQLWLKANGAVTIESAGRDLVNFRMDGPGGTFILQDPLTSSHELFLLEGTLDLDGFSLEARSVLISGSSASLDITDSDVMASLQFRINSISTLSAANSSLTTNDLSILPASRTLNNVTINGTNGSLSGNTITMSDLTVLSDGLTEISGSHTINGLLFLNNPGGEISFQSGSTTTLNDLDSNAGNCGSQIYLRSSIAGSVFTFSYSGGAPPPAADNSFLIIQDSQVNNGPFEADESVDLGNNAGWVINATTPQQFYWVGGSGDWNDPAHWSLSSGGMSAACIPTVNDNVRFDNNSFSAGGQEVNVPAGNHYCQNMEWVNSGLNAITNQPTLRLASLADLYVHGSLLLAGTTQMSYATNSLFASKLWMASRQMGNQIRSGGLDLINLRIDGEGGGWTLLDDLTVSSEFFLTDGSLNTDGFDLHGRIFRMNNSGASLSLGNSLVEIETMVISSSNIDAGTSRIWTNDLSGFAIGLMLYDIRLSGSAARLSFSGLTVNNLQLAGPDQHTLSGNILIQGDLDLDFPGSTLLIGAGNTLEINGDILNSALPGNRINIQSATPGSQAFLRKTSGAICLENLNIRDSDAGGGATFGAVNSTDEGNNSGWTFSAAASCAIFLPVECADFQAKVTADHAVQLHWTTWTEKNNLGFQLQRSIEDGPFETIAWVEGFGNSTQALTYTFLDDQTPPNTGNARYYRLLQIDQDGQENQACDIISVSLSNPVPFSFRFYPNPATHSTTLAWQQSKDGPVQYTVFDALGRVWRQHTFERPEGRQKWEQEVKDWPIGCYTLRLRLPSGKVETRRLVVSR